MYDIIIIFLNMVKRIIKRREDSNYFWKIRSSAKAGGVKALYSRFQYKKLMRVYNADIPLDAQIESVPVFPHELNGIFISAGAKIGIGCVIFQHVTIGSNTLVDSPRRGCPTIGNNVYIGAGAKIIGKVIIGNNVRIGANCVVTEDIPDNATVVLGKPRIILHNNFRDNSFVSFGNLY